MAAIVTSGGLSYLRDFLAQSAPGAPSYIVFGSGTAPVGRFMTTVPGETFRAPVAAVDTGGGANISSVTYHWFLRDVDNNQTIGAYGLVGGAGASLAANTGTLIAVANEPSPFGKQNIHTLSGDWVVTVSGVVA